MTNASADNDFATFNDAFFQGQAQFAQRIAVATRAVEVIDAHVDSTTYEGQRLFVAYWAKIVAKSLRAKGNYGDGEFGFTPASSRA